MSTIDNNDALKTIRNTIKKIIYTVCNKPRSINYRGFQYWKILMHFYESFLKLS